MRGQGWISLLLSLSQLPIQDAFYCPSTRPLEQGWTTAIDSINLKNGKYHPISTSTFSESFSSSSQRQKQERPQRRLRHFMVASRQQQQQQEFQYDASLSEQTFQELYSDYLPEWLIQKCVACGWEYPTLIQKRALDSLFGVNHGNDNDNSSHDDTVGSSTSTTTRTRTTIPNSMVIQAQTGSGKTLTYLLPVLAKLEPRAAIQAMIVVPTRELGLQVAAVAKRLVSSSSKTPEGGKKLMVMSLLQGSALRRQRAWAWAETPQIVIGTPAELLDMVQYGGLPRINSVKFVVVDEVDACLVHKSSTTLTSSGARGGSGDSTLSSSLHVLLSKFLSPTYAVEDNGDDDAWLTASNNNNNNHNNHRKVKTRQTIFASATIPQHRHFLKQCKANQWTLEEPMFVCTSPGEALPPTLQHAYMVCSSMDKKLATLRRLILKLHQQHLQQQGNTTEPMLRAGKILVFCDSSRPMEQMATVLAHDLQGIFHRPNTYAYTSPKLKEDTTISFQTNTNPQQQKPMIMVLRMEDSLSQRASATQAFAAIEDDDGSSDPSSSFRVLLTGDLAARGLDIPGISHVIHFDLPLSADIYLHRSGRAGRFGQTGQVISILTSDQEFVLQRLANALMLYGEDDLKCIGRQQSKKRQQ